jgi:two-component system sensor histidine kinase PilS (NtrC family)
VSDGRRLTAHSRLPDRRRLLLWLFAGRLVLAVAVLIAAGLVWTEAPQVSFLASVGIILALVVTAYGVWVVRGRAGDPGPLFLTFQLVADLGLVLVLVHFLGPGGGTGPALFVLLIAAYAVLLPFRYGLVATLVAAGIYVGDSLRHTDAVAALLLQVVVFILVFAVVAVLGQRLREAGVEQQTLEYELQRVRLEADVILRNIHSGVLTVGSDGHLEYANPTAQRLLGLERGPAIGDPVMTAVRERAPGLWSALVEGLEQGRRVQRGEALVQAEGGQFSIGLSTTTFQQPGQSGPSVTAVFTDISDSKRVAELQLRAERLEAVTALSASLAHEIKNPLASIRSSVEQLARTSYAGDDEQTLARLIVRESDRLSRLLTEFLDFSRVRVTRSEAVDLLDVANAVVRLVRAHPDCGPSAAVEVVGDSTMVTGDEDLLHRTLVNLVLNAVQVAGEEPVRVTVALDQVTAMELPASMGPVGQGVRVTVRDTGPGIPEEIRARLFEPFVSRRSGGSGLGLAIVQRAVESHRGAIFVESAPGAGTTFTIYLPARTAGEGSA